MRSVLTAPAADDRASQRIHSHPMFFSPPAAVSEGSGRRRSNRDGLFADPGMDYLIDFSSQDGFWQTAKKKKAAAKTPAKWADGEGEDGAKKDGDGNGNGGD